MSTLFHFLLVSSNEFYKEGGAFKFVDFEGYLFLFFFFDFPYC